MQWFKRAKIILSLLKIQSSKVATKHAFNKKRIMDQVLGKIFTSLSFFQVRIEAGITTVKKRSSLRVASTQIKAVVGRRKFPFSSSDPIPILGRLYFPYLAP